MHLSLRVLRWWYVLTNMRFVCFSDCSIQIQFDNRGSKVRLTDPGRLSFVCKTHSSAATMKTLPGNLSCMLRNLWHSETHR